MSQVVVFLMVLFITQTFRHERIMELAQQVANADLERSRQDADLAQKQTDLAQKQTCLMLHCSLMLPLDAVSSTHA